VNVYLVNRNVLEGRQRGIVLLEALIAIVLFALGVLGLLALQANSIRESTSARFRTDASMLADQLVGKMWVTDRDATALAAAFKSPSGSEYVKWLGDTTATTPAPGTVLAVLPQSASHLPDVTISQVSGGGTGKPTSYVSVTLYWKASYEQGDEHKYSIVTRIR
jgi:type IV pilus assembly protein PilV